MSLTNKRVMVVDDEPTVAKLIQELLKMEGHQVEVFHDPRDALSRFEQQPNDFCMLVTDQTMPGMTGSELAKAIMARAPDFPVVLCTGFSATMDADIARAMGIRAFFTKPLDMMEFLSVVGELLQQE